MNPQKKLLKLIWIFAFLLSNSAWSQDSESAQSQPSFRHDFGFQLGAYNLKVSTTGSTLSGFGALTLTYRYLFSETWSAVLGYQNLTTFSGSYASIASGFDLGAGYCFFNCSGRRTDLPAVGTLSEHGTWGFRIEGGITNRSFGLTTTVINYNGIFLRPELIYFWNARWRIVANVSYSTLKNGTAGINLLQSSVGLSFLF